MTPERWKKLDALFHEALGLQGEARAAHLALGCGEDVQLRAEAERLIAAHEREGSFIDSPILAEAAALAGDGNESLVGRSIGHYKVVSLLGRGGMGEVYLAEDSRLERKVALKVLPAAFTQNPDRVRRFEREAKAASALNHPNILTIHEIGEAATETGDAHYIVSEFVEGQTLRTLIERDRLGINQAMAIAEQVAGALGVAHQAGIIHRDIKPENVMVRPDGLVKVLDFGLAKLTERRTAPVKADSQAETLARLSTEPGAVMGTASYMSPEQARGQKVDERTDIFSLGVMVYEMIAGCRPFEGATTSDVMAAILTAEPAPLSQHSPGCSSPLELIVNRCLAKAPEQRYRAASELSAELKSARAAIEAGSQPTRAATERPKDRRWRLTIVVVALIVLMTAIYYFRAGRDTAETPIKQIAVLPPRPLQSSERDEAMEMGTAIVLITRLSSLRQLIVRPDTAVERYARLNQDPLAAGREQKVDTVLDTRYQRSGDKFRFTLRLLRVSDGATLWADTLDQPSADLFAIQDALSVKVTGALQLTLSDADKQLLTKRYTTSAEAMQLYVRGRHFLHRRQPLDHEKAITYFEQAVALDPRFALAHSMLGKSYLSMYWDSPVPEFVLKAQTGINLALKLDDQLAEAHTHLAEYKHCYEWDYTGAEQEHRRALDLNPNSSDVQHGYAFYQTFMGHFEHGIAAIRKAEELDPTDQWISRNVAQIFYFARRYDEAIAQSQRAIDLAPNSGSAHNWLSRAYELKGDEQRAFTANLRREELEGAGPEEIAEMKKAFAASGLKGFWRRRLDRLLGQEKSKSVIQRGQHEIAVCYARLGEKELALVRLEKAVEARELYVVALQVNPHWDRYRTDPGFMALVRRVGLTP